jgi:hypothetical protein
MDENILPKFTGTIVPANQLISRGVITGEAMVEHAVIVTDKATFPLAK